MKTFFSKNKILQAAISPYDNYCVGFSGKGSYLTALVISIGITKKKFIYLGSEMFDSILAYDVAEVDNTYLGQINMEIVSSFCGPEGLIWGYDIAKEESSEIPPFLNKKDIKKFKRIRIRDGDNLRKAAHILFGTRQIKHFPLLPGTIVPCAGRFHIKKGPIFLYAALAIGIPENRENHACVLMEDVGDLKRVNPTTRQKVLTDAALSVLEIGKNHNIKYKEIFVDFLVKKVQSDEIGCALIAMPYFHLAKKAFDNNLINQTLEKWVGRKQKYFLDNL